MDLLPSPEQLDIVDSAAAFLRGRLPVSQTRAMFDTESNIDEAAWSAAAELGWFALGLPELHGGIGGALADEALLFREIGRSLASGPFLSSVLAARVAAFGGRAELAEAIAAGQRVGMAIPARHDVVGPDGALDGELQLIDVDGPLVLVVTPDLAALVEVSALEDVVGVRCVDDAVRLQRAVARGVAPLVAVAADVDPIERRGHVLVAALLTGIAETARDISAEHAKNRIQFDRPIGVNQAVKHPCADMAVRAELALAQTLFAALTTDEDRDDAEFHALSAHLVAAESAELSTAATVQILGGMGFTFEHDAQLYVKRVHVLEHLLGGSGLQLTRLLALPEPH